MEIRCSILKIIADTDLAMQHSVNKDLHIMAMIITIRRLLNNGL